MNRIELDIRGFQFTLPINPIEFQEQNAFQYTLDSSIGDSSVRFASFGDPRHRVMTWRNLENKYPYTQLVSGLRSCIGISGVKMNMRDLNIVGDVDEFFNIFVEDVRIIYRKGTGPKNATNSLAYDVEMIFTIG